MGFGDFLGKVLDPGDVLGKRAGKEANKIQQRTTQRGIDEQREMFERLQSDKAPVLAFQRGAIDLLGAIGRGEESLPVSPGLMGLIERNQRGARAGFAARGKFNSGDRFAAEQDIASQLTSQDVNANISRLLNAAGFATGDTQIQNRFLSNNVANQALGQSRLNDLSFDRRISSLNNRTDLLNNAAIGAGAIDWRSFGQRPDGYGGNRSALEYAGYI